jgi:glucose-1-phosphate thymidylyltransferase
MKGVLLLGGSGSRLAPLNEVCNKHLINVGGKPMAQWNVEKLVSAGITDILIITGGEHIGSIASYFKGGNKFGCNITYKIQETAGGIAQAIKLVHGFLNDGDKFVTILGDNIFQDTINALVESLRSNNTVLTYKEVEDPERFGVIDYENNVIIEKPEVAPSTHAVCGVYGYTFDDKFRNILNCLSASERGELEVTDLNNDLMDETVFMELEGWWTDAGTHESLKLANQLIYG